MKIHPGYMLLSALGFALVLLFGVMISDATRPRVLTWDAVSVLNIPVIGDKLLIEAETTRRDGSGCSNGPQVDMLRAGKEIRLPVPERTQGLDGKTLYRVVLPDDIAPGTYQVRLRETFNCGGEPQIINAPWVMFTVGSPKG